MIEVFRYGEIHKTNRDKPLDEIRAEFDAAHSDLMEFVEKIDSVTLDQKLPFDWAGKLTVQIMISSNTHWHYIEHADSIEEWLASKNL